ncbi:MAG TPA: ribbon-helix-helix domain-containing protein [Thermoplasmata archaeon]|jgi:Arc/MetJ-type ribon-helix-helix transcriptional regulator|nr:ribbon-helix-helix domain-containing protein [Thermoplasmata archaeon]
MVDTSERVTVRIPQDLLEKLKAIQQAKGTPTISDTIREGLERFIEMNLPPPNIRKVVVDLSRQDNLQLEEFVREGNSVSVDDAVRSAVREYIRTRLETAAATARSRRDSESVVADGGPPP